MSLTPKEISRRFYERHKNDPEYIAKNRQSCVNYRAKNKNNPEYKARKAKQDLEWRLKNRESESRRQYKNNWMKGWLQNPENRKRYNESIYEWNRKNPERTRAHSTVYYAIKTGKLIPPSICSDCGISPTKGRLEAHHHDYSRPLEVTWLCKQCHAKTRRVYQ